MSNATTTETIKSPITVDRVYAAERQKEGFLTAQIRQVVTTKAFYPEKKVSSNMRDSLYSNEELGIKSEPYLSPENRVDFIQVRTNATVASVQADLNKAYEAGACIYKVLSSEPILDDNQESGLNRGLTTKDQYANKQVVRKPTQDSTKGEIITDAYGLPFYRRTFFSKTSKADQDLRDPKKSYMSPEIAMELQGATIDENQAI